MGFFTKEQLERMAAGEHILLFEITPETFPNLFKGRIPQILKFPEREKRPQGSPGRVKTETKL